MFELWQVFRAGRTLFSRSMQGRLYYANYFFLDLLGFFVSFGLTLMLWLYVDDHKPGGLPIPRQTFIAYMALALAVNFAMSIWVDGILGSRIRSGQVATDLLKPINFQWMYFFIAMGDVVIQTCMGAVVLLVATWVLPTPPLHWEPARLAAFALSFGLGLLVQYGICFLFTLGTFYTHFGYGIFYTRLMLHQAFSGVFAPLLLYPDGLRAIAHALPFQCVVHTPVSIGLGLVPLDQVPFLLAQQALWAVGLLTVGQFGFRVIVGRLSIQGG